MPDKYIPPYVITNRIINLVADISEIIGSTIRRMAGAGVFDRRRESRLEAMIL